MRLGVHADAVAPPGRQLNAAALVWTLSLAQGFLLGLLFVALPVLLWGDVSLLGLAACVLATLPDVTKHLWIDRRLAPWSKPALLCVLSLLGATLLYLALPLEVAVADRDLPSIVAVCFVTVAQLSVVEVLTEMWIPLAELPRLRPTASTLGVLLSFAFVMANLTLSVTLSDVTRGMGYLILYLLGWAALTKGGPSVAAVMASTSWRPVLRTLKLQKRSFVWVVFLGRLPFVPFEYIAPLKLLEKGLSLRSWMLLSCLHCIPGALAGVMACHIIPPLRQPTVWTVAYYCRLAISFGLTLFLLILPQDLSSPGHFPYLATYAALMMLSVFAGNLLFTLESLWTGHLVSQTPQFRPCLLELSQLGRTLFRVIAYCASDLLSHRICFRQDRPFRDVPCPIRLPLPASWHGAFALDLCTDSGGTCHIVWDAFYALASGTLLCGAVLGWFFHISLKDSFSPSERNAS